MGDAVEWANFTRGKQAAHYDNNVFDGAVSTMQEVAVHDT